MGDMTKIDWADATWNPVTGCYHDCPYCYARRIAQRFDGHKDKNDSNANWVTGGVDLGKHFPRVHLYDGKVPKWEWNEMTDRPDENLAYPYGFEPTIHLHRLEEPQHWRRPRNVFVCSMGDLFGAWVPDEWIIEVLNACRKAPWHRYLFLTKNPERYDALEEADLITDADMNFWLGTTTTDITKDLLHFNEALHTFQSCEPMLAPWPPAREPNEESVRKNWLPEWVIFGAETGNRKDKVVPEKAWVDNAVKMCRNMGAYVFMKESLREIMGDDFIQEFPWEAE